MYMNTFNLKKNFLTWLKIPVAFDPWCLCENLHVRSSCHCYQMGRLNDGASWLRQDFHEWGHCHVNDLRIIPCVRTEVTTPNNIKTINTVCYVDSCAMHNIQCVGWMLWIKKTNSFKSVSSHYTNWTWRHHFYYVNNKLIPQNINLSTNVKVYRTSKNVSALQFLT